MNTLSHEEVACRQVRIPANGVFEGLQPHQLSGLEAMGVYMEYDHELVTADGHPLDYFFFIIQGDFEVLKIDPETGKKHALATIGEGQCFGEMSFFTRAPASANVVAMGKTVCWAIPHESLRQFIESHEGGASLAINVATLLARRVQEGNTRLVGLSASLSAYFGTAARAADPKTPEAPQTADHADMEIPDDVFDDFARDVLGIKEGAELTADQRAGIRSKIEANEVDIVPWLERGQCGQPLKVRLKFVHDTPRVAVSAAPPKAQAGPVEGKIALGRAIAASQPMVVRVPQVRARVAPAPVYVKPPRSPMWRLVNIASFLLLPLLTVYVIFLLMPLDSRESIAESAGFKKLPMREFLEWFIFRSNTQSNPVILKNGAQYKLPFRLPKPARLSGRLEFQNQKSVTMRIVVKVGQNEGSSNPAVNETIEMVPGSQTQSLFSVRLPPGSYACECACEDAQPGVEIPATWIISVRY